MKKMNVSVLLLAAILMLTGTQAALAADIILPSPEKSGGAPVFEALANRSSAIAAPFDNKEIPEKDLSTLLWAATGLNRERGWTVPMAQGAEPYVDIYVLLKTGIYRYNWDKNQLLQINPKNLIPKASGQSYVGTAPCVLVFATKSGRARIDSWADVAVGAMSQNIYLAGEALGLKARYAATFNKETLLNNFELAGPLLRIIAIMPVGYQTAN